MTKNILDNKKLSESLVDIGLFVGTAKPGMIIASKSANKIQKESLVSRMNKKINKLLR